MYVHQVYYIQGSLILLLQRYFSIITFSNGEIIDSHRKGYRLAEGHTVSQQQGESRAYTKSPGQLLYCADPPVNMA